MPLAIKKKKIMNDFKKRSDEIKTENFVEAHYCEFAKEMLPQYYSWSIGIIGGLLRKFRLAQMCNMGFRRADKVNLLNILRCEAHREVFVEGLKDEIYKKN